MNKQKFIELLREPSSISKDELSGLETVTRQYPYFQSAHLLLAKGSRLRKDPNTKKRISSAAVYCTDRILLKKYISGDMIFLDSVDKPPINVDEELPEKKVKNIPKPKAKIQETKSLEKNAPQTAKEITVSEDPNFNPDSILDEIKDGLASYKANKKHFEEYIQEEEEDKAVNDALSKASTADTEEVEQSAKVEDSLPEDSLPDNTIIESEITTTADSVLDQQEENSISAPEEDTDESEDDELEFDISGIIEEIKNNDALERESLTKAVVDENTSEEKPVTNTSTPKDTDDLEIEETKPEESNEKLNQDKKSNYSNKIVISGSNKSKEVINESTEEKESEVSEIKADDNKEEVQQEHNIKINTESDEQESEPEASPGPLVKREDLKIDTDDDNLSPGELRKAKMKRLKMQKEIIDDFIDTTPQMPKPDRKPKPAVEKEKPKDLSAPSQVAKTEIISENMAIIYKNQGKLEKAVDIYNKLILKFPEKEAYFAARIKELK